MLGIGSSVNLAVGVGSFFPNRALGIMPLRSGRPRVGLPQWGLLPTNPKTQRQCKSLRHEIMGHDVIGDEFAVVDVVVVVVVVVVLGVVVGGVVVVGVVVGVRVCVVVVVLSLWLLLLLHLNHALEPMRPNITSS